MKTQFTSAFLVLSLFVSVANSKVTLGNFPSLTTPAVEGQLQILNEEIKFKAIHYEVAFRHASKFGSMGPGSHSEQVKTVESGRIELAGNGNFTIPALKVSMLGKFNFATQIAKVFEIKIVFDIEVEGKNYQATISRSFSDKFDFSESISDLEKLLEQITIAKNGNHFGLYTKVNSNEIFVAVPEPEQQ